ncbi:hypothetical protein EJ06DRAFT_341716 [Trichodelitschia bisporula]|uniref:WIBG Mago-binding domain-containing protein n=1 Tax=Trichodelitschia bisporula TaxID=703511 RepID=A0A6G1I2S2_9PEZI|nr:hypothetical protein EJ06DRAFT_341716 [Trichodelitschia bisporula]
MAPGGSPTSTPSKAGITVSEDGTRTIPSSVRPDGSVRKEIRIRPGYRPPEDVEVYRNPTAQAWKNSGKPGVPGAELASDPAKESAASSKNRKRKQARKKAATSAPEFPGGEGKEDKTKANSEQAGAAGSTAAAEPSTEVADPEKDKEKEVKKLMKKLRQARELKEKKDQGADLLPEQFEKVIRMNELLRQLSNLGIDARNDKGEP